jgi:hypothetical protein
MDLMDGRRHQDAAQMATLPRRAVSLYNRLQPIIGKLDDASVLPLNAVGRGDCDLRLLNASLQHFIMSRYRRISPAKEANPSANWWFRESRRALFLVLFVNAVRSRLRRRAPSLTILRV